MSMIRPSSSLSASPCCPSCGYRLPENARIRELETQVQLLSEKVSATKYDTSELRPPPSPTPPTSRISSFLFSSSSSSSTTTTTAAAPPTPPPDELAKERHLRLKAEEQLQQVTAELEDLSASLFQSANEMVAEERRARSKLEERVATLEKRDLEKRERLGVLERAVDRISRVREILGTLPAGERT